MTNFRNIKIAINDQQPLDEVVNELERLGYKKSYATISPVRTVIADNKYYSILGLDIDLIDDYELTTLAELKEMQDASK